MCLKLQQRPRRLVAGALSLVPVTQKVHVRDLESPTPFFRISMEALHIPMVYNRLYLARSVEVAQSSLQPVMEKERRNRRTMMAREMTRLFKQCRVPRCHLVA
jgi:hypothetical protein